MKLLFVLLNFFLLCVVHCYQPTNFTTIVGHTIDLDNNEVKWDVRLGRLDHIKFNLVSSGSVPVKFKSAKVQTWSAGVNSELSGLRLKVTDDQITATNILHFIDISTIITITSTFDPAAIPLSGGNFGINGTLYHKYDEDTNTGNLYPVQSTLDLDPTLIGTFDSAGKLHWNYNIPNYIIGTVKELSLSSGFSDYIFGDITTAVGTSKVTSYVLTESDNHFQLTFGSNTFYIAQNKNLDVKIPATFDTSKSQSIYTLELNSSYKIKNIPFSITLNSAIANKT